MHVKETNNLAINLNLLSSKDISEISMKYRCHIIHVAGVFINNEIYISSGHISVFIKVNFEVKFRNICIWIFFRNSLLSFSFFMGMDFITLSQFFP